MLAIPVLLTAPVQAQSTQALLSGGEQGDGPQILTSDMSERTSVDWPSMSASWVFASEDGKKITKVVINGETQSITPGETLIVHKDLELQRGYNLAKVEVYDELGKFRKKSYMITYVPGPGVMTIWRSKWISLLTVGVLSTFYTYQQYTTLKKSNQRQAQLANEMNTTRSGVVFKERSAELDAEASKAKKAQQGMITGFFLAALTYSTSYWIYSDDPSEGMEKFEKKEMMVPYHNPYTGEFGLALNIRF